MILMIDNYDSFVYNIAQYVGSLGEELIVIRNDELTLEQISALSFDRIILSPGPGKPNSAGICLDLIKKYYTQKPILGICLGHQAIGEAFGTSVQKARYLFHGKTSPVFHHGTKIFKNIPNPFIACRYHSLILPEPLPEECEITAYTEDNTIMALEHKKYPVFGVQFHPESILTEKGIQIIENFLTIGE